MISHKELFDSNYGLFPPYREKWLWAEQLDLFKLAHYDNKNRMVSLKRLEFEMDMLNIEEMPIHHTQLNFTEDEIQETVNYCWNDVDATEQFYYHMIGEVEHPLYKGNDQVQLRRDLQEEFEFNCLNWSDSKIGDEVIKKFYCEEKKIKYDELPRKGTFRKEIHLKNGIPKYVKFETKQFKSILKEMKEVVLSQNEDYVKSIEFGNATYTLAKGGLHSNNKPKIYESNEEYIIIDCDVSSYYPAIIINNGYYPIHLGKQFLNGMKRLYDKRIELKPLAKTDKRIKGIVGAYKLSLNSVYGKSSDMQSWLFDKQMTVNTCITGELSLLMLIEMCELNKIEVIMANTDGITLYMKRSLVDKLHELCDEWMSITNYELEFVEFKKIVFSTVNDYLGIKSDGEIKYKGDFTIDYFLHMNKSKKICSIALQKYFIDNISIEDTIRNHTNIFDFMIRQKASSNFHYEGISDGKVTAYNKLIRYYISNSGEKLLKIKNDSCETNAAKVSECEAPDKFDNKQWSCTVKNKITSIELPIDIDYEYYIRKANRILYSIYPERKRIEQEKALGILSLF